MNTMDLKLNREMLSMTRTIPTKNKLNRTNIGVSPSGKATDSDSVIPKVRILPPQPQKTVDFFLRSLFFYTFFQQPKERFCN